MWGWINTEFFCWSRLCKKVNISNKDLVVYVKLLKWAATYFYYKDTKKISSLFNKCSDIYKLFVCVLDNKFFTPFDLVQMNAFNKAQSLFINIYYDSSLCDHGGDTAEW